MKCVCTEYVPRRHLLLLQTCLTKVISPFACFSGQSRVGGHIVMDGSDSGPEAGQQSARRLLEDLGKCPVAVLDAAGNQFGIRSKVETSQRR